MSTSPFGEWDPRPIDLLRSTGWIVCTNTSGKKLGPHDVAELARDCAGIVAGTEDLGPLLHANPELRMIARVGIGLDSVPLQECRRRGIAVTYTPDAVTMAVAEFTIGLMIGATRSILRSDTEIRAKKWYRYQGLRLGEAVIGLVGFGRVGSNVARLLFPFAPEQVLVYDKKDKTTEIESLRRLGLNIRQAELFDVISQSDILSLHVPLSRGTRGFIGANELQKMKRSARLINTARGGIVDEFALFNALRDEVIAGAAIDVFADEPYSGPLTALNNVVLTAHLGSCAIDCRARMEIEATEDLIRFFSGDSLRNPVPDEEYENQL